MEILGGAFTTGTKKSVVVRHLDQDVEFVTVNLTVPDPNVPFGPVVDSINSYWATLPPEAQDALYALYAEAHEEIEYSCDIITLHDKLAKICVKICDMHDYDKMFTWFLRTRPVQMPDDLKMAYDDASPNNLRTYLVDDYIHLTVYTILLKCMLPIWGEYIQVIAKAVGSEFKEARAAALIKGAKVNQSKAAIRLRSYVEASATDDELKLAAILGNMSSVNFPDYLLTLTIVRRLVTARLPKIGEPEKSAHLIRDLYSFLKSKVAQSESLFTRNTVRDKSPESGERSDGGEDNTSKLELVKLREEIDKGALERYREDCMNPLDIYHRLDCTAPDELFHTCRAELNGKLSMAGDEFRMWIVQRVITGHRVMWPEAALKADLIQYGLAKPYEDGIKTKIFGPQVIQYLELPERLELMAVTQALLLHWGFPDVAALISSKRVPVSQSSVMGVTADAVSASLVGLCFETYPHLVLPPAAKIEYENLLKMQNVSQRHAQMLHRIKAQRNPLLSNVHQFVEEQNKFTWIISVPTTYRVRINFRKQEGKWVLPSNIKNQLVVLVLMSKKGKSCLSLTHSVS